MKPATVEVGGRRASMQNLSELRNPEQHPQARARDSVTESAHAHTGTHNREAIVPSTGILDLNSWRTS